MPHDSAAVTDGAAEAAASRLRWKSVSDEDVLPGFEDRVVHPEFDGMEFVHVRARSVLNRVPDGGRLPFSWTINVYRGCSHACTYCFARPSHEWLELNADEDFDRVIVVKVNAVERVRAELRSAKWRGEHVAMGTNTDPYQRCEGRYRLTRGVVATLAEAGNPFSILTKSSLVARDLDILTEAAHRGTCRSVSLSIGTLDDDVWRLTEPMAPLPRARLETVARLREAGISSGVMIAPIIPGLSDDPAGLRHVIAGALEAGATSITPIVLHLRPGVREVFLKRLAAQRPDLVERFARTYATSTAPVEDRRRIAASVRDIAAYLGAPPSVLSASPAADSTEAEHPRRRARRKISRTDNSTSGLVADDEQAQLALW
ncbi:MAG: radical SAM protein [Nitriliruptoraceae bacterium]